MITLSQAFKLLGIKNEIITLQTNVVDRGSINNFFWSEWIRKSLDMKKIVVKKVLLDFGYDGYNGFIFVVSGITDEEIAKQHMKYVGVSYP